MHRCDTARLGFDRGTRSNMSALAIFMPLTVVPT
jgi:hypothetical protein